MFFRSPSLSPSPSPRRSLDAQESKKPVFVIKESADGSRIFSAMVCECTHVEWLNEQKKDKEEMRFLG